MPKEYCRGVERAYIDISGEVICSERQCPYYEFVPALNFESYERCTNEEVKKIIEKKKEEKAKKDKRIKREITRERERKRRLKILEEEQKEGIIRDLSTRL